jgi:hypothetical protein
MDRPGDFVPLTLSRDREGAVGAEAAMNPTITKGARGWTDSTAQWHCGPDDFAEPIRQTSPIAQRLEMLGQTFTDPRPLHTGSTVVDAFRGRNDAPR